MTGDSDIRDLLGRALDGEPPLRIDRDDILRQGRKRLRRRRAVEASSVVAGVVAIAVGAVTITGLLDEPERRELPPAASDTVDRPAPPGPTLPLPTTDQQAPPSSQPSIATTERPPPAATSDAHARKLTAALHVVLPNALELKPVPGHDGPVQFTEQAGSYELSADVYSDAAKGSLLVSVGLSPRAGGTIDCTAVGEEYQQCEVMVVPTGVAAVATQVLDGGEKRYLAMASWQDGTMVSAVATNLTEGARAKGIQPEHAKPVLDQTTLANLVTLPGLSFYG